MVVTRILPHSPLLVRVLPYRSFITRTRNRYVLRCKQLVRYPLLTSAGGGSTTVYSIQIRSDGLLTSYVDPTFRESLIANSATRMHQLLARKDNKKAR